MPLFLGEAALYTAGMPRLTWCPLEASRVEEWPARTGAAEVHTPPPTHTPTSPAATRAHPPRVSW